MGIENKALDFAIKAHNGQVRKSEPDKPMIFHPINVGHILKEYGFDENVIAAGYLHDVVEDTEYTIEDIEKQFGDDIASLVYTASEPDKSLPWLDRKKHTIETIKEADIRHKAIVCADKISNLEDLYHLFGKSGKVDFSYFKKGFNEQEWYYYSIYESLIHNEDRNMEMFKRMKSAFENTFHAGDIDLYLRNVVFDDDNERYSELKKLHHKKQELLKLKSLSKDMNPYVIEFTGTPRTGKTSLINNLNDFFKKGGFKTSILEEFTTSNKYKKEIYPKIKNEEKSVINTEIPKYVLEQLREELLKKPDIILIDRSLLDRLIWIDRLYEKKGFTKEEYDNYKKEYIPLIKKYIDIIIGTYTDSLTSIKRDYNTNLALEERHFLNIQNVDEYNKSFNRISDLSKKEKIDFYKVDTTNRKQDDISIEVANTILDNARNTYINRLKKEYKIK